MAEAEYIINQPSQPIPPTPRGCQICPVPKIKNPYYSTKTPLDVYNNCRKKTGCFTNIYSPLSSQGNNPNISTTERISQILNSKSLGGKVQFVENGDINGQRQGQPGGVRPPLRNRF